MTDVLRDRCPDPELVTALVDGELDPTTRDALLSHLGGCGDCRELTEAERDTRSTLRSLPDPVPSAALTSRLTELPALVGPAAVEAPIDLAAARRERRGVPAYLGAAASVVVFMVGAFAFVGATAAPEPAGGATTAVVPAADRLTVEHAASTGQTSLGGPGFSTAALTTSGASTLAPAASTPPTSTIAPAVAPR